MGLKDELRKIKKIRHRLNKYVEKGNCRINIQ